VLATRVKRAHKMHGQKLIVADLREHEMAARADVFFRPRPGTDLIWISAVTKYILDNGLARPEVHRSVGQWCRRVQEEPGILHAGNGQRKVRTSHRDTDQGCPHDRGSRWRLCSLGHGRDATLHGVRHLNGDLQSIAGHRELYEAWGRSVSPARTQQCAGSKRSRRDAELLPGISKVGDPAIRAKFEKAWNVSLPPTPGLDNHMMIDAIHERQAQGHVSVRRRDEPGRFQRELRFGCAVEARLLCGAGDLLQRDLPLRRCHPSCQPKSGKGRYLHQHGATHPAAL
jgi:formate dehydrogenase major subunit